VSGSSRDRGRAASLRQLLGAAAAATALAFAAPVASASAATTAAALTCTTPAVAMYHVDGAAQLRRWGFASPLDGTPGWTEQMIGTVWNGLNVVSGGNGMIYTIDQSGNLRWYDDDNYAKGGGPSWDRASGSVIGTGWNAYTTVISGGGGVLYAVDSAGGLHWFRDLAMNGTISWAPGSGSVIGSGFNGPTMLVAGGSGVIFAVDTSGNLKWFRHLDPSGGSATWVNGGIASTIGAGWSGFTQMGSLGGGVLMARDGTGTVWWYRDADPLGGTGTWANGGNGIAEGTGWSDGQLITDVDGCTVTSTS
jgi:Tachylectin